MTISDQPVAQVGAEKAGTTDHQNALLFGHDHLGHNLPHRLRTTVEWGPNDA
jgi:hypothetical protein